MDCPHPKFDFQVRVQRSFSFEELQSGAYFACLDESDLQFYRVYGQPVLIPPLDELDNNFIVHGTYPDTSCDSGLHLDPPILTSKSYTLQNPLGDDPSSRCHNHDRWSIKQEPTKPVATYYDLALYDPALSCQLYTLPDPDNIQTRVASPLQYGNDQKPFVPTFDKPPMDCLPYPPPMNSASLPYFQIHSPSPLLVRDIPFQMNASRDHSDNAPLCVSYLIVPSQSHMLDELPSLVSTAYPQPLSRQYPSITRSHPRHSQSLSPRLSLRMSPSAHVKRSQDKKPTLACLFCRGRKIACGSPKPGSKDKTCNQCARRHLKCEYPPESRRGMRKRRSLIPRISSTTPDINPDRPRVNIVKANRKCSIGKSS